MADPFKEKEKSLEETATWAVAVVCFVLIVISLFIERLIHKIGTWLKQKHKGSLYEALEKVKAVAQTPISKICIPKSAASSMRPCSPTAHFAPGSGSEKMPYDFFNYIQRTLEKDFKTVVDISPVIWFVTLIFLLTNSDGNTHWLLPLKHTISLHHKTDIGYHLKQEYVVLIVGTKLQVIITKLGLRIQEKSDVVRAAPVVQPGDDLFWFDNPSVMLFLIHLVLLINAFQLAFFAWSSMGTRMKPTVFNKRVSKMLNKWHHKAQKETQHGRHSESNTPTHDSSPIHLLHNSNNQSGESFPNPRLPSHSEHHDHRQFYDPESQQQAAESSTHLSTSHESASIELPTIRPANA
ncbi:hypothetical protein F2Q70_00039956 [Brassica cretica]|uniref:MLO-like protein n=1 Tax=Brassica cretica TaxID=69181 RepID=A0A8S9K3P3_BRACR|nr:hypothetical protein F2Q70_00039956 [Brassica cretica]